MSKPPVGPVDEAKRARTQREKAARPKPSEPLRNGHDQHARVLKLEGWHELGEPEAQDALIADIMGPEQLVMIYGESGSGKSFATFDMYAHYALRREWLGHKVRGEGACLYIAAEGRGGWANRVNAFCLQHDLDEEARALIPFKFIRENINLGRTGNGDVQAVIDAARRFSDQIEKHVDMIAVDTVARATPGSNENDAADMGAFVSNMDRVRTALRATVGLVHHSGKNAALGARGHSSLRAAVDSELEIERGTGSQRILRIRKSRDGADGTAQAFDLRVIEVGRDPEGASITSCVVVPVHDIVAAVASKAAHKRQREWQEALDVLNTVLIDSPADHPGRKTIPRNITLTTRKAFAAGLRRRGINEIREHDTSDPKEVAKAEAAQRQSFKRLVDELRSRKFIQIDDELLWRCDLVTVTDGA